MGVLGVLLFALLVTMGAVAHRHTDAEETSVSVPSPVLHTCQTLKKGHTNYVYALSCQTLKGK